MTKTNAFGEHHQRAFLKICDKDIDKCKDHDKEMTWLVSLCEIVDISYSLEPEFTPVTVT